MSQTSATDSHARSKRLSKSLKPADGPSEPVESHLDPPTVDARHRRAAISLHVSFLLVAVLVLVAAVVLRVNEHGQVSPPWGGDSAGMPPLCFFQRMFGMDCPGCGLTRCFVSLGHGQVTRAWEFHPVGVFMFVIVVAQLPYRGLQLFRLWRGKPEIQTMTWAPWLAGALGVLLIGQWVVRMIV